MKNFYQIFFLLAIFIFSAPAAFSQDKTKTEIPVTLKTNLLVLDSKDQYADIKLEDVKLTEDGIEQKPSKLTKKDALNVGIVIDRTGSMRTQLDTIIGTATMLTANLRDNDAAFLVSFVSRDNIQLVQDWTSNKSVLKRGIDNIFIEGGHSAVTDALMMSAEQMLEKKAANKRNALILISDCEDRDSYYKLEQVLQKLKENDIEVYVIGLMRELDDSRPLGGQSPREKAVDFAKTTAIESGGAAYFPNYKKNKKEEIINTAKAIVMEIRSQYIVEYVSTNSNPKHTERKIAVQIADGENGEKRSAVFRPVIELGKTKTKK